MSVVINDNYSEYVSRGTTTVTPQEDSFGYNYSKPSPEFDVLNVSVSAPNREEYAALRICALTKSAISGNAAAQLELGLRYLNGDGVMKDKGIALKLIEQAANQGNPEALYQMGIHCRRLVAEFEVTLREDGLSNEQYKTIEKSLATYHKEMLKWFERAADNGYPEAQFTMALENLVPGVNGDKEKGFKYLTAAAEQGHIRAQELLSVYRVTEYLGE